MTAGLAVVAAVRLYRATFGHVPRRRRCLYRVTCSRHAEAVARSHGLVAGTRAACSRLRSCRPGYAFVFAGDELAIECADGTLVAAADLAPEVLAEAWFVLPAVGRRRDHDGGAS